MHLAYLSASAVPRLLILVDLPLGEAPGGLGPVGLHQHDVRQLLVQQDSSVGWHRLLVFTPVVQDVLQVGAMLLEEWYMLEEHR